MTPTDKDLLRVLSPTPRKVTDLALALVPGGAAPAEGQVAGQFLAQQGISLSAVQQVIDGLVRDGRAVELRGAELWASYQEGLAADARGRHFRLA